jgi:hypothetical protein
MFHPHSLLWHYLWVGPHVLQLLLAVLVWRKGFHRLSPIFFSYLIYEGIEEIALYLIDVLRVGSYQFWWHSCFAGMLVEGLVKLAVVWEVCHHLTRHRKATARSSNRLLALTAVALIALSAFAAAHAPNVAKPLFVAQVHILAEMVYIVMSGLWLFTFLFAARFRLAWTRHDLGIALGGAISACVHLGTSGLFANNGRLPKGYLLDFLNMATYHAVVLIWFYYLLPPPALSLAATIHDENSPEKNTNAPECGTGKSCYQRNFSRVLKVSL